MPTRRPNCAAVLLLALAGAAAPLATAAAQEAPATQAPPATAAPAAEPPATPADPAASAPAAAQVTQVPLTAETVEKFVSSWPTMEALGDEFAEAYGVDPGVTDPTSAFTAWSRQPAAKTKLDEALSKAGFSGLDQWIEVANSVVVAYGYDAAELAPERLDEIVAEIQGSTEIPEDQKATVIAQVRQEFARAAELKPLPGNPEVVAPFAERLAEVFGDGAMDGEMVVPDEGEAPPADGAAPADTPPAQ